MMTWFFISQIKTIDNEVFLTCQMILKDNLMKKSKGAEILQKQSKVLIKLTQTIICLEIFRQLNDKKNKEKFQSMTKQIWKIFIEIPQIRIKKKKERFFHSKILKLSMCWVKAHLVKSIWLNYEERGSYMQSKRFEKTFWLRPNQ